MEEQEEKKENLIKAIRGLKAIIEDMEDGHEKDLQIRNKKVLLDMLFPYSSLTEISKLDLL